MSHSVLVKEGDQFVQSIPRCAEYTCDITLIRVVGVQHDYDHRLLVNIQSRHHALK
jgi:hypothetical protein